MRFNLKSLTFLLIGVLLVIPLVSADINQVSVLVKVYNNTISFSNSEYAGNNQVYNFSILYDNVTNATYVPYQAINYTFLFTQNVTVGMDLVQRYFDCVNQTNTCLLNSTATSGQSALLLSQKDSDAQAKQVQIDTLTKDAQNKQNLIYLVGAIMLGVGIFGTRFVLGKGKKAKDKERDEFNPLQAR